MDQQKEIEVIKEGDYRPAKVELVHLGERPGSTEGRIFDFGWVLLGTKLPGERYRFITEGPDFWDDKTEFVLTKDELDKKNIEVLRDEVQGMMEFKASPDEYA